MKQKLSYSSLVVAAIACSLLVAIYQVDAHEIRIKRQVVKDRRPERQEATAAKPPRTPGTISASASATASNPLSQPELQGNTKLEEPETSPVGESVAPEVAVNPPEVIEPNSRPVNRPQKPPKGSRRPPKPSRHDEDDDYSHRDEDGEEDCYEADGDDDDYHHSLFDGMSRNPMRQFASMMNNAFQTMQGAYDDYNGSRGRSGSRALSSSLSGGDGYSKAVSSVTTNGRSRGFVSETRNGRTSTRRIGPDDEDEYYA